MTRFEAFAANTVTTVMIGFVGMAGFSCLAFGAVFLILMAQAPEILNVSWACAFAASILLAVFGYAMIKMWLEALQEIHWYEPA